MRVDCKYYESRTYASGDTVRMCRLDLAPEAPWRCPDDCPAYSRRLVDVGWSHGSLAPASRVTPDEPDDLEASADLLEQAEEILNAAGAQIIAEHEAKQSKKKRRKRRK